MNKAFISLIQNPPKGFKYMQPTKKDILGACTAIIANSKEQALSLIDNFTNRAIGVIITKGDIFSSTQINTSLLHITTPQNLYPNLHAITSTYLNLIISNKQIVDKNRISDINFERIKANHTNTQDSYNTVTKTLNTQIQELKLEIIKRKKVELDLHTQNNEYFALNEELKASEENLQALNEELSATTDALENNNKDLVIAKKRAEDSNRLKTEFINNMSHEIRTPMNGIIGFSNLLDDRSITPKEQKQYINIIKNSSNQLLRIIDDILEISRLETKQVRCIEKEVCLNDLLFELFLVLDIKAKDKKIPLYLKKGLNNSDSTILVDPTKLYKIFENLLTNSLKFTQSGFIEFGYSLKKTSNNKNIIEFFVKDTGIGIDPEQQEIIFDRFSQENNNFTENYGGLGLGLSIAKENTEIIGGEIRVLSQKGKGSTFFITIPYKPVHNNSSVYEKQETNKFTILIAEDEEINYLYLETLIYSESNSKYNIIHAKNGQEAVDICKNNTSINLILMDIKMPLLNGYEAAQQIKKFNPNLSIIAQTAFSSAEDIEQAKSVGFNNFISKPIEKDTIMTIINKYANLASNYSSK